MCVLKSINLFKKELAILWEDETETYIPYAILRGLCPCAFCRGEKDVLGNRYGGEEVVPELIQDAATPGNIAREALRVLKNPEYSQSVRAKLSRIRKSLGTTGVSRRAAESIALHLFPAHEKADC